MQTCLYECHLGADVLTSFCSDLCSRHVVLILANAKGQCWTDHTGDTHTKTCWMFQKKTGICLTPPHTHYASVT